MLSVITTQHHVANTSKRHTRLAAVLSSMWGACIIDARTLAAWAVRCPHDNIRARVLNVAGVRRAHASRLLARLAALGRGPLPVPMEAPTSLPSLSASAAMARTLATICERADKMAVEHEDLSTAWVFRLMRTECIDGALELNAIANDQT